MPGRNPAFIGCPTSQKHQISLFRIPVVSAHEGEHTSSIKKEAREKWLEVIFRTREITPEVKKRIANNNIYITFVSVILRMNAFRKVSNCPVLHILRFIKYTHSIDLF